MKILIADDSHLMRERLCGLLMNMKASPIIEQAQDGREALEKLESFQPDAIILDIRMPGKNGIQVLEKIRNSQRASVTLVFTNYTYPQYRNKCLNLGADYFFDKSTEFENMLEKLEQLSSQAMCSEKCKADIP
ncbi:MAG: response regulator transcription factor [SAR324 cluster bacterium]|nr:response regulator transcription factor [SAR324 cluster bacterium]